MMMSLTLHETLPGHHLQVTHSCLKFVYLFMGSRLYEHRFVCRYLFEVESKVRGELKDMRRIHNATIRLRMFVNVTNVYL